MSARRQLLAVDDFIVFNPVKILDARDLVVTAALIEPHRRGIAFLRRRLDQQHASALAAYFVFDESQEQLADALSLTFRIDSNPVEIEDTVGQRSGTVADVTLNLGAVGIFE